MGSADMVPEPLRHDSPHVCSSAHTTPRSTSVSFAHGPLRSTIAVITCSAVLSALLLGQSRAAQEPTSDLGTQSVSHFDPRTDELRVGPGSRLVAPDPGTAVPEESSVKGLSVPAAIAPIHETIPAFLSTPADGYRSEVPVLIISYLPTADGVNLDTSKCPDYYSLNPVTLAVLRGTIATFDQRVKFVLEQGSRFRAYRNPRAVPSLGYRVVDDITVFEQTPPGKVIGTSAGYPVYAPDWFSIFSRLNVAHYVNDLGVREIWFWQSGLDASYPSYNPATMNPADFRSCWESNMSSALTGDISNSNRDNTDLPVYAHTYTVYGCNFRRSQAEAVHNHGHQIEAQLAYVNQLQDGNTDLWWKKFVGQNSSGQFITGRCGWTHMPPNTTTDYDYLNTTLVASDIEDWTPSHTGSTTMVNVNTWGNKVYAWPDGVADFSQRVETQWYLYWMQSVPGYANTILSGTDHLTNWWDFLGSWDASIGAVERLHQAAPVLDVAETGPPRSELELRSVSPNPVQQIGRVTFAVTRTGHVDVVLMDVQGRAVRRLFDGVAEPGDHTVEWMRGDPSADVLPAGIYLVRVSEGGVSRVRRVALL
jgi:hypothetical protein